MKFFGTEVLREASEWARFVGAGKFRPGYSAHALASTWQEANGFPPSVAAVLAPLSLTPVRAFIEWVEELDCATAPSATDLLVEAKGSGGEPVVVGVEGKCRENFGVPVDTWVRNGSSHPTPTRLRRLEFLSHTLGVALDVDSDLRYQLLHRTASVVLRARSLGATRAVLLVHAFPGPTQGDANFEDWTAFLRLLGVWGPVNRGALLGPIALGDRHVQTSFAWVEDPLPVG